MSDPGNMDNATDIDRDLTRMCEETHRANTYGDYEQYVHHPKIMAKAGFYELDKRLICFRCGLNIDIDDIGKTDDIVEVHQTKRPSCVFARNLPSLPRSRLVVASDLRYETKRLETFIDWPLGEVIEARDLAAAGFFYSRRNVECICFCCKVRISFKPCTRHGCCARHASTSQYITEKHLNSAYCDFAMEKVTGNVPIRINKIISKIIGHQETDNEKNSCGNNEGRSRGASGEEDGGDSRESENDSSSRISAGNILSEMGIESYSGPEHENFVTPISRKYTYDDWPLGDIMLPKKLIAAGFFYSGKPL